MSRLQDLSSEFTELFSATVVYRSMSTDAASHPEIPPADLPLPDDPAVLQRMIRELLQTLHKSQRENAQLAHRLQQLLRRLYGPRAERFDPNQPLLFADASAPVPADTPPAPPPSAVETTTARKQNGHGRRKLPRDLPRRPVIVDLTPSEKLCPECGQERQRIGAEVTEQLDYQPASLFIVETTRYKYACSCCQGHVSIAAKPAQPIDKGLPGAGLLAHVIVNKYGDHLPLYRQEHILARHGVELERSTLCGWMAASAELLTPLYERMTARVLQSRVIHTDDTPVPVLDENRNATRQGRLWLYFGDEAHPDAVFSYTPDHSRKGPANFLTNFAGYLQADAFVGYDAIYTGSNGKIREVACWAHARRKFFEAKTTALEQAHEALARIRQLYDVEDEAKEEIARLPANAEPLEVWERGNVVRLRLRQEKALPVLTSIRQWLETAASQVLPKSPMGQAIAYTVSNWEALCRYTEAGFLNIDNNISERTLRAIGIGRKNWMFFGSDNGGKTAAVLFSFTATCKRHGIDPFFYLHDVLARLPTHPADRLAELLPDRWAAAQRLQAQQVPTSTE